MKQLLFFLSLLLISVTTKAQIENVSVELYYVSDSLDATDTTDGRVLEAGSKTYRVYVDLKQGSKIKNIFGGKNHPLKISSTAVFYNNINRPTAWFGYLINKAWFGGNPTMALDSWLTLGLATKIHYGVPKAEDANGSIVGGTNNGGGSSSVPGGLLVGTGAGIALTTADGLAPNTASFGQWLDYNFKDISNVDTTIFGSVTSGSNYCSKDSVLLQQNALVGGYSLDSNKVLVAQLTTKGDISFELNLEIQNSDGSFTKYVAKGDSLKSDQQVSPFLKYPAACGCLDPNFLEYKNSYSCSVFDSCKTRIVFGCKDTMACNYSASANFNIQFLCCYPGYCNDRDLDVVCPQANSSERKAINNSLNLYPNPAQIKIEFEVFNSDQKEVKYCIYNSYGKKIVEKNLGVVSGLQSAAINELDLGLYYFALYKGDTVISKMFLKN